MNKLFHLFFMIQIPIIIFHSQPNSQTKYRSSILNKSKQIIKKIIKIFNFIIQKTNMNNQQQQQLLPNPSDLSTLKITTQIGPWRSETVPIFYLYQHSVNKNISKKSNTTTMKNTNQIFITNNSLNNTVVLNPEKNPQKHIFNLDIQQDNTNNKQKYNIEDNIINNKCKYHILSKYLQKEVEYKQHPSLPQKSTHHEQPIIIRTKTLNKFNKQMKCTEQHSTLPLTKSRQLPIQKTQLYLRTTQTKRYNQQLLPSKHNKKSKNRNKPLQKLIQASLLPNLKSNTAKLLNIHEQKLFIKNFIKKSKSNHSIKYQQLNVIRTRTQTIKKKKNITLAAKNKNEKSKIIPIYVGFF